MALAAALWASLPHGDTAWDLLETVAPFAFTEPIPPSTSPAIGTPGCRRGRQQTRTAFAARALLRDREASAAQTYGGDVDRGRPADGGGERGGRDDPRDA